MRVATSNIIALIALFSLGSAGKASATETSIHSLATNPGTFDHQKLHYEVRHSQ
jgi:hypothetical protein